MTTSVPPACLLLTEETWGAPLHAIRSLGAAGAVVLVATAGQGSHVFARSRTKLLAADFDPAGGDRFLDEATAWARSQARDRPIVVLAFSDRITEAMHRRRDLLVEPFRPVLAPPDALDRLLDKAASLRAARQAGLCVPPWHTLERSVDLDALDDLRTPIVLKPSSWSSNAGAGFKISVHGEHREAHATAAAAIANGARLIAQEYRRVPVDAVELGITWRSHDGSITAVCTGRKRRQSAPDGGVMAWGEAVDLPDVADAATEFMDSTGFTGTGGIEFVRTEVGLEFIEFNPRLEAIHFLAAAAGIDVVRLSYDDIGLDRRPTAAPTQHDAAAWIGSAWLERLRSRPADLPLMIKDRLRFARRPHRDRAVMDWHDLGPATALTADLVGAGARRLTSRRSAR